MKYFFVSIFCWRSTILGRLDIDFSSRLGSQDTFETKITLLDTYLYWNFKITSICY